MIVRKVAKPPKAGARRKPANGRKPAKGRGPTKGHRPSPALTVGVDALVEAGSDAGFRDFVADLFAAASSMQSVRRALGQATGLSGAEIAMLLAVQRLAQDGPVGIGDVARHLHVAGPHVTTEVARLVGGGLLSKDVRGSDGRAVDITLTAAGRGKLRELRPLVRVANDLLFAGMTREEMDHAHRFLTRIAGSAAAAVAKVGQVVGGRK